MNQVEKAEVHMEYAPHGRTGLVSTVRSLCSGLKGRRGQFPGIIIPVREGKSTCFDRCNCRGIALLSVPGKAFTV